MNKYPTGLFDNVLFMKSNYFTIMWNEKECRLSKMNYHWLYTKGQCLYIKRKKCGAMYIMAFEGNPLWSTTSEPNDWFKQVLLQVRLIEDDNWSSVTRMSIIFYQERTTCFLFCPLAKIGSGMFMQLWIFVLFFPLTK